MIQTIREIALAIGIRNQESRWPPTALKSLDSPQAISSSHKGLVPIGLPVLEFCVKDQRYDWMLHFMVASKKLPTAKLNRSYESAVSLREHGRISGEQIAIRQ
ncbi:hypothetical protein [Glutamicibacter sp. 0426]|uniref:hypothetical protein n=1 Tax=Glutamicibacter sp. 0426 TaxID=1913445 RepID=UPI00116111FA|nr:hypothetical protein [Glutamicibacter sp. 0426]